MYLIIRKINRIQFIGILCGVLGGAIILDLFNKGISSIFIIENITFMICSLTWGVITVLMSYGQKDYDSLLYIILCYFITSIISLFGVDYNEFLQFSKYDLRFFIHFFIVSIGAMAFGTSVYTYSAIRLGPIQTSVFIFTVPFIAMTAAFFLLSEQITYQVVAGGVLAIFSVYLVNFKK